MNDIEQPFRTLAGVGDAELVVERSRFIGLARPFDELEAALEFVESLRAEHYNARHVCYGLRIGHGSARVDRSQDDGEPARTGGFPLWQLLEGEELTDSLLVVVRYFGGIKLGTGGLARAYRDTGRLALDAAGILTRYPTVRLALSVAYDMVGRLEYLLAQLESVQVAEVVWAAEVTFLLDVHAVALHDVRAQLSVLLQRPPDSFHPQ